MSILFDMYATKIHYQMTKQTTIVVNGGLVNQLLREQSDLGPHCLICMLLKYIIR